MNPSDTGSISEALTQTLGNSNLMLSNLHQMQHQLNFMSSRTKFEKIAFLLQDEVKYSLEGLSVNLNAHTSFKFIHDDRLPDMVLGNL
jgi:hypothetical protein